MGTLDITRFHAGDRPSLTAIVIGENNMAQQSMGFHSSHLRKLTKFQTTATMLKLTCLRVFLPVARAAAHESVRFVPAQSMMTESVLHGQLVRIRT